MSRDWLVFTSLPDSSSTSSHLPTWWWSKTIALTLSQNIHKEFQRRLGFKMIRKTLLWIHHYFREVLRVLKCIELFCRFWDDLRLNCKSIDMGLMNQCIDFGGRLINQNITLRLGLIFIWRKLYIWYRILLFLIYINFLSIHQIKFVLFKYLH